MNKLILSAIFFLVIAHEAFPEGWKLAKGQREHDPDLAASGGSPAYGIPSGISPLSERTSPELYDMAASLSYDPLKIFAYVRNNIEYDHYFGSKKGAHLTLVEGSGNDFDQCALLITLIRIAKEITGRNYIAEYQFGFMEIPFKSSTKCSLSEWWGVEFDGSEYEVFRVVDDYYRDGNFPLLWWSQYFPHNKLYTLPSAQNSKHFVVPRVVVHLNDEGHLFTLDPAFKKAKNIKPDPAILNLVSASELINSVSANSTYDENFASALNYESLANSLATASGLYVANMGSTVPKNKSVKEIIGGLEIVEEVITAIPVPEYGLILGPVRFVSYWESPLLVREVIAVFQHWQYIPDFLSDLIYFQSTKSSDFHRYSIPDLQGDKLSITFPGNNATIKRNDSDPRLIEAAVDDYSTIEIKYYQPSGKYYFQNSSFYPDVETSAYTKYQNEYYSNARAYLIFYGFESPKARIRKAQANLENLLLIQGATSTAENVITESLHILGLKYLEQDKLIANLNANIHQISFKTSIFVGIMGDIGGDNPGYFINLPLNTVRSNSRAARNWSDPVPDREVFDLFGYFASALEHAVLEQNQPNPNAASTVKCLFSQATSPNGKIFLATKPNWNTVKPQLAGYPLALMNKFDALMASTGNLLLLPVSGLNHIGMWNGSGYVYRSPLTSGDVEFTDTIEMAISGNLNGGFSRGIQHDPNVINSAFQLSSYYINQNTPSVFQYFSEDPVNLADGAFVLENTALQTAHDAPRGLSFSFAYNSKRNNQNIANMAHGWTHNYIAKARVVTDPPASLGGTTARQMATSLIAAIAAYKIYTYSTTVVTEKRPKVFLWTTVALISKWATDQLLQNAVTIEMGTTSMQFIKVVNSYVPPAGSDMTLSRNLWTSNFELNEHNGRTFNFDSLNRLQSIKDPFGKELTLAYAFGKLDMAIDSFGRRMQFKYQSSEPGRLEKVIEGTDSNPDQRSIEFKYDNSFNANEADLVSYIDPENHEWKYDYDSRHQILVTKEPRFIPEASPREIVRNEYDTVGRVKAQFNKNDLNRKWIFIYGKGITLETDPLRGTRRFFFDDKFRLTTYEDQLGNKQHRFYNGQNHIVKEIRPSGGVFLYEYNDYYAAPKITKILEPDENGSHYQGIREYNLRGLLWREQDFKGGVTEYEYNQQGLTNKIIYPHRNDDTPNIVEFGYFPTGPHAGLLEWVQDQVGNKTFFEYDDFGSIKKRILPIQGSPSDDYEEFRNNYRGDILDHWDFKRQPTSFTYDKKRQKTTVTKPGMNVMETTTFIYDSAGNLWKLVEPNNYVTEYHYDQTKKLLKTIYPLMIDDKGLQSRPESTLVYDTRDWLDYSLDSLQKKTDFTFNAGQRLVETIDPLLRKTTTAYDAEGNQTLVETPLQSNPRQQTIYQFGFRGQLKAAVDSIGTVEHRYDNNGNLWKVINRKDREFEYGHYGDNKVSAFIIPSGKIQRYRYHPAGMMSSVKEPSLQETTFQYDNRQRLKYKLDSVTGSTPAEFIYDENGSLRHFIEGSKTIDRQYDPQNRLKSYFYSDSQKPNHNYSFTIYYDTNNCISQIDYPGNRAVKYWYNSHKRLTTILDWKGRKISYHYDVAGKLRRVDRFNGTSLKLNYNDAGQIDTLVEDFGGKPISFLKISYDSGGRIQSEVTAPSSTLANLPAYFSVPNNDNQIATFNGQTISYDDDGNMKFGPTATAVSGGEYSYDSRNQLTMYKDVNLNKTWSFSYDQEGNRVSQISGSIETIYANLPISGVSHVLFRKTSDGKLTFYIYGNGLAYEVGEDETPYCYHFDIRGSTTAISDNVGNVIERFEYRSSGALAKRTTIFSKVETPFLFVGKSGVMTDPSGLHFMRARYYNPNLRRFITPDPIGLDGGLNFYAYAEANSVSLIDPLGLAAWALPLQLNHDPQFTGGFWMGAGAALPASIGIGAGILMGPVGGGAIMSAGINLSGQMVGHQLNPGSEFSATSLMFDTTVGAAIPYGLSRAVPAAASLLPNSTKGMIGEGLSYINGIFQGRGFTPVMQESISVAGRTPRPDFAYPGLGMGGETIYVEAKFGSAGLTSAQRAAASALGNSWVTEYWTYGLLGNAAGRGGALIGGVNALPTSVNGTQIPGSFGYSHGK